MFYNLGGVPTWYGAPEYWKTKAATLSRTKPSRAPRPEEKQWKKNDGCPPDTVKELFGHPTKKIAKVKQALKVSKKLKITEVKKNETKVKQAFEVLKKPKTADIKKALKVSEKFKITKVKQPMLNESKMLDLSLPAYPWSTNSCWLDASLQVLYMAVTRNFNEFTVICKQLDWDIALGALYTIFCERFDLDFDQGDASAILASQRDVLRHFLQKKKIISSLNEPESAVVHLK